jgi:uncharacterized protein (DUF2147 family)
MRKVVFSIALASTVSLLCLAPSHAFAAEVTGTWLRDNGGSQIKLAPFGDALCGTVVWLKPGYETKAKLGQRIFFDMKPDGANAWKGSALNPDDGQTYSGKMSLSGTTLTTAGCAMGGLICKSATWARVN